MQFHWPSFLLGYGSGLVTALFANRLRPVLVELGAMASQILDSAGTALARQREDVEDLVAEAQARGRRSAPEAPVRRRRAPAAKRAARARPGALRAVNPRTR